MLCLAPAALAEPVPGAAPSRPGLRQRVVQRIRNLSLRTANGYRNLRDRVSPVVRHGAVTVLSSGVTYAAVEGLASRGDISSPVGLLSLAGVVLGVGSTARSGIKTLRSAFPERSRRIGERIQKTPVLGPWIRDSRPWLQRLRSRFLHKKAE